MSLISGHSQAQSAYEPTLWAQVFHSAPHVNITLHPVDSRFNPENDLYLEAVGILASIPAAWLITTLVVLLIYLCTRCCDTKSSRKRKSRPMRCCLAFFALVACTALAVGFLGNHIAHTAMEDFERATQNINDVVERSQEMAQRYNQVFQNDIEKNLNRLYDGPFQRDIYQDRAAHFEIMDNSDVIFSNITSGLEAMDQLRFAIDAEQRVNGGGGTVGVSQYNKHHRLRSFQSVPFWARAIEKYRWPTTMALQALFALFCLLLFVGAVVHSRCVLILFSVCGLFSIIVLWLLSSVYTFASVALADFCYDPTPWVQHALKASLDQEVTAFYLRCAPGKANPFDSFLSKAHRSITDIDRRVRLISGAARKYYSPMELSPHLDDLEQSTEETMRLMNDLNMSLRCEPIFRSYNTALVAACDGGLFGLILMLISVSAAGLLFTLLVWCNSHTWIYFKHKGRYIKVDDADPYMPLSTIDQRPRLGPPAHGGGHGGAMAMGSGIYGSHRRHMQTPPQTPPYHGTINGHGSHPGHGGTLLGQRAPSVGGSGGAPPAYGHISHGGAAAYGSRSNVLGTLGRNQQMPGHHAGYQGMDSLPATMTLGRRGHYASLRGSGVGKMGDGGNEVPLLGPNMGQYATLSKQCKTLESSDFY